jgi:uncharacterized protein YsxB (DUF464 family)
VIRARVIKRDGLIYIETHGHARSDVCCAVSMMLQACALGLRDLAKQFPRHISFEEDVFGGRQTLDSTDTRKQKRARR